jgi:streptogramin lyase
VVLGPAACTVSGQPEPEDSPAATGAPTGAGCGTGGTGTLEVTVTGLPDGAEARVTTAGTTTTGSGSLTVAGGEHEVVAEVVVEVAADDRPLVRQAYAAQAAVACVRDGEVTRVAVTYGVVPTSGMLWVGNDIGGGPDLLGFAAGDLSGGDRTPEITAATRGKAVLAFDRTGNLWLAGRTLDDPPLLRYPAALAAGAGRDAHDVGLSPAVFGDSPTAEALAFDADGNLWAAVQDGPIVMFTADQISRSGSPAPTVEIGGLVRTRAIAFDSDGNLWASNDRAVVRFDAQRLTASTADPPDLVLDLMSPPPVVGPLPTIWGMAFDADGNLWVNHQGTLFGRLTPTDQDGSGRRNHTPQVQVNISITALAQGIAFDDDGGLWFVYDPGRVARLAPSQLSVGAGPGARAVPETIIESADLGQAGSVALYPAPAGLPLHHSLPGR